MRRIAYAILAGLATSSSVAAQTATVMLREQRCSDCAVAVAPVVTLGADYLRFALDRGLTITRAATGKFMVSTFSSPGEIAIYNSDGTLNEVLSRRGSGPGEFQAISRLRYVQSRGLVAYDPVLRRITLLHAGHDDTVFPLHFSMVNDIRSIDDGFLIQGTLTAPEQSGYPLHVVDDRGTVLRTIGQQQSVSAAGSAEAARAVAVLADGTILLASRSYELERYSSDGRVIRRYTRSAEWFPARAAPEQVPGARPHPVITAIEQDEAGLVWILIRIPASGWSPETAAAARESGNLDGVYNTRVEVLDLERGIVIAGARSPRFLFSALGSRLAVSRRQTDSGVMLLDVWQLSLRRN